MKTVEQLRKDLNKIMKDARDISGIMEAVSRKVGMSIQNIYRIAKNERTTLDSDKNRATIKAIIKAYEVEIKKHVAKLNRI